MRCWLNQYRFFIEIMYFKILNGKFLKTYSITIFFPDLGKYDIDFKRNLIYNILKEN